MEIKEQKDYRKDFPLLNNNSSIYIDNAATATLIPLLVFFPI